MGWPFEDLDERIQAPGTTLDRADFSAFRGTAPFASWSMPHCGFAGCSWTSAKVVAVGGGAFAQENNAALLEQRGVATIFLDAPVEELFRRCQEQPVGSTPARGSGRIPPAVMSPPALLSESRAAHRNGGEETWRK